MRTLVQRVALGSHDRLVRRNRLDAGALLQDPIFAEKRPMPRRQRQYTLRELMRPPNRKIDMRFRQGVIFHRFGSLTDFSRVHSSYAAISRKFWASAVTIRHIVQSFVAKGHRFEVPPRAPKLQKVAPRVRQALLTPELLQEWAPYTLKERVELIRRVWGVSVSDKYLSLFYRHNGVRLRQAKKVYRFAQQNSRQLAEERKAFAVTLGNLLVRGTPIIYTDESTFTNQQTRAKSWSLRDHPNQHYIDSKYEQVTVYGAVGDALTKNVWLLAAGTNQEDYQEFLRLVARHVKGALRKPILLYDGHKAHTTARSMETVLSWFTPLQNCRYSSNFNSPIESYWGLAKRRLHTKLLLRKQQVDRAVLRRLVQESLDEVPQSAQEGVLRANRAYVRRYLQLQGAQE